MKSYDFVVIGSGIAGLSFALRAARHGSVALITKRSRGDSNTAYAQGGVACVTADDDSFDLHIADTLATGAGLSNEEVVRTIVSEGPARIRELIELGVRFDEEASQAEPAAYALAREGGHSRRRILHARDATGREIERALLAALAATPAIVVFENHMAVDLITTARLGIPGENRCAGVHVLNEMTGEVVTFRTNCVVLATGGCGRVYRYTTNPGIATGDGVAMAWRAGARIANMEFIQFHPTCLYHPTERSFLISEAVRGEGGRLVDAGGRAFMAEHHPLADLAPRDVVARAIDAEMKRTGAECVYLDITHQSAEFLRARFPTIHDRCLALGIDITRDPIPVVPAAHYQCGGVLTDVDGATSLRGLYAIGEVGCTGLHGANRLASNSLLEAVVVAQRAAEAVAKEGEGRSADSAHRASANGAGPGSLSAEKGLVLPDWVSGDATDLDELVVIYHNWDEIRRLMWDYVGIVRTDRRLQRARTRLKYILDEIEEYYWGFRVNTDILELRNLATVALLIVESALSRRESRGLHYNLDHPGQDEGQRKDTILVKGGGDTEIGG